MTEQKTFIRKHKQGNSVYYAEVYNERVGKKIVQHHVRYLGVDPNDPSSQTGFDIEKIHFGYLAQLLLSDMVIADDIYTMLENMGESVERKEVKSIILRYDLGGKKLRLQLVHPRKKSKSAPSADESSSASIPSGGK